MAWVIRLFVLGVVIIGGCYAYLTFSNSSGCQGPGTAGAPSIEDGASYYIKTPSRSYYAEEINETESTVTMSGYWDRIDSKWIYNEGVHVLERSYVGKITIFQIED